MLELTALLLLPTGALVGATLMYGSAQLRKWPAQSGESGASIESQKDLRRRYVTVRSIVDPVAAAILLVLCLPLLALIWSAIRLTSSGPALFRQRRVGQNGRPFTMVKFRTLQTSAPSSSLKLSEDDSRITVVGRFLRRSGLDELPQLWNVVRGEMAMIGPRPEQLELIGLYEPWQLQRHLVKPGITGWWQIHHRDSAPMHLNIDKDLFYIQHQSLWLDAVIALGTVKIALGAVQRALELGPAARHTAPVDARTEGETA